MGDVPGACGMHIHEGTSCEAAGGHFFAGDADPWAAVAYKTQASADGTVVKAGTTLAENAGRVVLIHDSNGTRVACAPLMADVEQRSAAVFVTDFSSYPGYAGGLAVQGVVSIMQVGLGAISGQVLEFSLKGADPLCGQGTFLKAGACGIHVQEGTNCSSAGGHYFAKEFADADPWATVRYIVSEQGTVIGAVTPKVVTGKTNAEVLGRTVVVHDHAGERIACGVIVSSPLV